MTAIAANVSKAVSWPTPRCAHCDLPVPSGLIDRAAERQFCCGGCRAVFEVISGSGLEGYYRLRERLAERSGPARVSGRRYDDFDDAAFAARYWKRLPGGLCAVELYLEGVHCGACVWLVEKLPHVAPGCVEAALNLGQSLVRIIWDPARTTLAPLARALDSLGYPPHPARDVSRRELRRQAERKALIRIAVAGACAGNSMLLAFALYSGAERGLHAEFGPFFRWLSMAIGLVTLLWPGSVFFRGAWAAIRTRTPHLDIPIAIGLGVGAIAGTLNTLLARGDIYFDSLAVLVFLLLVGRWIQGRQQRDAADALELLFSLTPTSVRLIDPERGMLREISMDAVTPGMLLEVRAGDSVPVDGLLELGTSQVDQSLLTGESRPVSVQPGDRVCAGTVNLGGKLYVRAVAAGAQTRVGRLMRLVEESARRRAPLVRFADRLAGWFVIVVTTLAALTLGSWLLIDPARAADNAAALLIVTCPCALGLATPLALSVGIARAARRQILIKGGDAIERLSRPGVIFLDKTGTLTEGRMALMRWVGDTSIQSLVADLERHSSHPVARALVEAIEKIDDAPAIGSAGIQIASNGISGVVAGRKIAVGSQPFISEQAAFTPDSLRGAASNMSLAALTPVLIAVDGVVVAVAGLGDPLRHDSAATVAHLRRLGWRARIISGDHPDVVRQIGRDIGLPDADCIGGVTPEQKLALVEHTRLTGPVVMVGDGVNDAAALAAATVGIAVHGGAEASLAAADIYLNRPGVGPIVELLVAARRTLRTMRRGLGLSLFYNCVAGGLAIGGLINPLIAAILMPISSFSVLALAFSARPFRRM